MRAIESDDLVLIFDDMLQATPFSNENELISWHYDHRVGRRVKGINLLNCIYTQPVVIINHKRYKTGVNCPVLRVAISS